MSSLKLKKGNVKISFLTGVTGYITNADFIAAMRENIPDYDFGTATNSGSNNIAHISNSPNMSYSQSSQQNVANATSFAFNGQRGTPTMNGIGDDQSWTNSSNDRGNNVPNAQTGIGIDIGENKLIDTIVIIAGNSGAGFQPTVVSNVTVRYSTAAYDYASLPVNTSPTIEEAGQWGKILGTWKDLGVYTVVSNPRNSVLVFRTSTPVEARYFHVALTSLNATASIINSFEIYNAGTYIDNQIEGVDYTVWQFQSPNFGNQQDDRTRQQLINRNFNDWWYRDLETDFYAFVVPSSGVPTSGASSIRAELREMLPGLPSTSVYHANWRSDGFHRMEVDYIVKKLGDQPTSIGAMTNGATAIGQVWGANSSMFELAVNNDGTFVVRPPRSGGVWTRLIGVSYQMGVPFTALYEVIGDTLKLYINDNEVYSYVGMPNTYYFKAGNYDQSTLTTGLINRDPYSTILIGKIVVQHNTIRGRLTLNGAPLSDKIVNYTMTGGGIPNQFNGSVITNENGYYTILNNPSQANDNKTAKVVITPPTAASIGAVSVDRTSHTIQSVSAIDIAGVRSSGNDFIYIK